MNDAAARRHPVHVAGADRFDVARAVAVNHLAFEQIGQRRQADMRMRTHVRPVSGAKHRRPEMVEEDEGTDHAALRGWQRAANLEAITQIPNRRKDHVLDRQVRWNARNGHCHLLCAIRSGRRGKRLPGRPPAPPRARRDAEADLLGVDEGDVAQPDEAEQSPQIGLLEIDRLGRALASKDRRGTR